MNSPPTAACEVGEMADLIVVKAYLKRQKIVIGEFAEGNKVVPWSGVLNRLVEENAAAIHLFLANPGR